jgi:hypothetical protein
MLGVCNWRDSAYTCSCTSDQGYGVGACGPDVWQNLLPMSAHMRMHCKPARTTLLTSTGHGQQGSPAWVAVPQ